MMKKRPQRKYKVILLAGIFVSMTSVAQVSIPKSLALEYSFSLASIPLGHVEKRLNFNDGIYTADSDIKPNTAAKLLYKGEVYEKSTFKVEDNILTSLSFHAVRINYKPYDRKAIFNINKNTVTYNNGESEKLRENTYDLGSFPFAFMLEDLNTIENKVYQINNGKGYRAYEVLKPQRQRINTPAGDFDTTKITLKRQDSENRFYYVWLADSTHYPVKIERNKDGKKSTLELRTISE